GGRVQAPRAERLPPRNEPEGTLARVRNAGLRRRGRFSRLGPYVRPQRLAGFEVGFDLRAGAPGRAQRFARVEVELVAPVRRAGLRGVAVAEQHAGADGVGEGHEGDV